MSDFEMRTLYLRHTDKHGNATVREHRVWSAERFLTAADAAARKEGGKAQVEVIDEETYKRER